MTRGGGFFRYLRIAILGRVDGKEWLTSSRTFFVTGCVYGVDATEGSDVSLWLVWTSWHGGCLLISDFIVQWRPEVQICDCYESSEGDSMVFPARFLLLKDSDPREASARLFPAFI